MDWLLLLFAGVFEVSMTFGLGKARGAAGFEFCLCAGGFLIPAALSMGLLAKASQTPPLMPSGRVSVPWEPFLSASWFSKSQRRL